LTAISRGEATHYVGHLLFGSGIFYSAILLQFLNPFFEELIVRAYLMTEIQFLTGSVTKAVIISTILQTSYHLYQGGAAAISHAATFLIFSIFYAKTNRITPVILAHLYSDVSATLWYWFRE
jgi:membrane protease YdiL (CAAX protease family)